MSFRLACADFTFPLLPHDRVLQLIAMLEFPGVDIGLFEGRSHLWPSHEFADLPAAAHRLQTTLARHGLAAADIYLQLAPDFEPYAINQPDAARRRHARDQFLRTLDYAGRVGAAHVTTLPGVNFPGEAAGRFLGAGRGRAGLARGAGAAIMASPLASSRTWGRSCLRPRWPWTWWSRRPG